MYFHIVYVLVIVFNLCTYLILLDLYIYVQRAADNLRESYINSRFCHKPNEWPPYHHKHYTTLALIQHKGKYIDTELISVTEGLVSEGNLNKSQYNSKDISEFFSANWVSPYFLLIEGAPGIGKTVLSKEIAYQWAKYELLKFKKLAFLLLLQDPCIFQLSSLESLIQYLFKSTEKVSSLSKYLDQTEGKDLIIIFDGYDEMSEEDRNNSLVAEIISRNVLPKCDLVITSRPSASVCLRHMANCRVEVLGFTEEDRLDYIQHAFEGSDKKIEALQLYLQSNSAINALCYIPLNMTILLCLFEELKFLPHKTFELDTKEELGLPNTQAEMYEKFILITITHFIKKSNTSFSDNYLKISELPKPYNKAFDELLLLAYNALIKDQIVFNLSNEMLQAYPILKASKLEGLGLLKATKYVNYVSFHFLHFSIQEYLAAYYIALQPYKFQLQLLRDTFWDFHYFNTWIMYVDITGGKNDAWRHFISGNRSMLLAKMKPSEISKSILKDKIKSLYLFQCFAEIGSKDLTFEDKIIDLSNQTLLPKDISTICFLLSRSVNKHWVKLDLSYCNIGKTGSDILCKKFLDNSRDIVSIDKVDLSHNRLQVNAMLGLLEVVKFWHTLEVVMYEDCLNDDSFELCLKKFTLYSDDFSQRVLIGPFLFAHNIDIHDKLTNLANVTNGLYLNHCNYPSANFTNKELSHKFINLSKLHIIGENICSYFIGTLVQKLKEVDSVYIYDHTLSDEDVKYISLMLYRIKSSSLGVWMVTGGTKILGNIPDIFTLNKKFSPVEISNLTESIERLHSSSSMATTKFSKSIPTGSNSVFKYFFHLLHDDGSKCEINFCLIEKNLLIANGIQYNKIKEVLTYNTDLSSISIRKCDLNKTEVKEITNLISKQESLETLYFFNSSLEMHYFKYENLLNQTLRLKELFIHNTYSSRTLTFDFHGSHRDYPNISVLLIANNTLFGKNPTRLQILLTLQLNVNLAIFKLCNFLTNFELFQRMAITYSKLVELDILGCNFEEGVDNISKILSYFTKLKQLSLCHNDLQEGGAGKIFYNLTTSSLIKLTISYNEINEHDIDDITDSLSQIPKLEELDLSCNNLQVTGTLKLLNAIKYSQSFTKLNISNNSFNDKAADSIATFLSHNPQVKELDLSYNNLKTAGVIVICERINNSVHLTKLNLSNNNISDAAADNIAAVLSHNKSLEELDLSCNNLGALGSLHIICNMKKMSNLIKLNICSIGITEISADDIATVLNNNNKLEELDLSHNNIQAAGATIIFKKASIENLLKFDISYNNITDEVNCLASFLSRNSKLKELNLSHNNLAAPQVIFMADISTLSKFNISYNSITTPAVSYIANFLSHNTKLQILDLSCNDFQEVGCCNAFKKLHNISNLSLLKISHSSVVNTAADELANFLYHNTSLQELDLSYNYLSISDATKIFKGMENISNLITINISHNMITDEAADNIATVLSHNMKLKEIDLSYTKLSTSDITKIFSGIKYSTNLTEINISHNMITDEATKCIAIVLSHASNLESLDISSNCFTSKGFVKLFESLKCTMFLRKLNISCNKITKVVAAESIATVLSHSSKLEYLNISNMFIQSAAIIVIFKSLKRISNLRKIYINGNMITDEAADDIAVVLSQNIKLEELDISCNDLQTPGVIKILQDIKDHVALTKLNISHNTITNEAAENVINILCNNSKLQELNLRHNILLEKDVIIKMMLPENATKKLTVIITNLQELDLSNINLKTSAIKIFAELDNISTLSKFDISKNHINSLAADDLAKFLSKNSKLQELNLSHNDIQESGINTILFTIKFSNLTKLNISNNNANLGSTIEVFSHPTQLEELDLSYNKLNNAADIVLFFSKTKNLFVNLIKLNISGIFHEINVEACKALANVFSQSEYLKELNLSNNNLHSEAINVICSEVATSSLIKLNVSYNNITYQAAGQIATILSKNTKLKELDLSHNNLKSAGAVRICWTDNTELINFNISHNSIKVEAADHIASFLSRNTKLEILDLRCNDLQESGCNKIFEVLKQKAILTSLKISNCNIINYVADNLAIFLFQNPMLQELDISYSNLSTEFENIFKTMINISNFVSINISHNTITDRASDELATLLFHNPLLQEIDLSYNNLSTSNAVKIFKAMRSFSKLETINIGYNKITSEAAKSIKTVVLHNHNLHTLNMSFNFLKSKGYIEIFNGMKNNLCLRNLDFSCNKITWKAADSLAAVLSQNTKLKELDISYNELQTSGAIKILQSIEHHSTLTKLNISHNMITNEAAEYVINILCNNNKLQELNLSHNILLEKDVIIKIIVTKLNFSITITNVQELDLSNINLRTATDDLAQLLSKNSELHELNLSNNNLPESDINMILHTIKLSKLTKLNISANNASLYSVIEGFSCATKLKELDMSYNKLNNAVDIESFFSKSKNVFVNLIKLNISGICHEMNDEAAKALVKFISLSENLMELNLSENSLNSEVINKIFNKLNTSALTKFNVSHNNITDEAAGDITNFLYKCIKLENFDLSHNNLQDAGIIKLCRTTISSLISFDISHNNITVKAANDVATFWSYNSQLQVFDLSSNGLLEVGVKNIKDMQVVENIFNSSVLNISNCSIINETVNELLTILSNNTILKNLDLSYNDLLTSNATKIFTGMKNISNLRAFNISHNMIADEAADKLATVLLKNSSLQKLDLSYNNLSTSDVVKIFTGMKNISNLRALNISHNMIADEAADKLATVLLKNSSLQKLDLSYNNLSTSDVVKIFTGMKNISKLRALNISHNMIADEAADELATVLLNNSSLQKLDLSYNNLSTLDVGKIFTGMKNILKLRGLNINHNMIIDKTAKNIAILLSHNTKRKSLELSSSYFTSKNFAQIFDHFKEITSLRELSISFNEINTETAHIIATFLSHNLKLKVLDLNNNCMQAASSIIIFESLTCISNLIKICFNGNMITHEAAGHIATVLMHNNELKEIDMSGNELLSVGAITLFHGMKNNFNLTQVNISENWITCEAADDIANVLSQNTNLQKLYLSANYLQASGISTLLRRMSNITKITHLDISSNKINDEAADDIATFILHNSNLKVLDLSNNLMQAGGARTIFGRTCANTICSLTKLNFSGNALDDEAADIIATFLSQNPSLEEFDLSDNYLQAMGAIKIFKAIQNCPNIPKVNMSNNWIRRWHS